MGNAAADISLTLTRKLFKARKAMFLSRLLAGFSRWLGINLTVWGMLVIGDSLATLPVELRLPLAVFAFALTFYTFYRWIIRPLRFFYSVDRTAYELERLYGVPRNLLINSYQLSKQDLTEEEAELARQTVKQGMGWAGRFHASDVWEAGSLLKVGGFALLVAIGWLFLAGAAPHYIASSLRRFSLPFADIPPPGGVLLTVKPGRDITVNEHEDYEVFVLVEQRGRRGKHLYDIRDSYPRIVVEEAASVGVSGAGGGGGTT